jgi:hypothetical protein
MSIVNFGNFAGGLMRGHMAAQDERRKEEDQEFQKEQRKQWREEQERQKRIREGIAGVKRPGAETARTQFMAPGIDGDEAIPGAFNVTQQTDADYYRQLGDVYAREGMVEQAEGMRDRLFNLGQRQYQTGQQNRTLTQQQAADAALARRATMIKELQTDMPGFLTRYAPMFNADQIGGDKFKGSQVAFASTPNGQTGYIISPDGKTTSQFPVTQQSLMEIINGLTDAELSAASPEQYSAAVARGIQREQAATGRITANAAQRNAETMERYRSDVVSKPTFMQDGSGRVLAMSSDGTRVLGTYGNPRPDSASAALNRPNVRTATINVPDPTTGKVSKVPINVVTQLGANNVPKVAAYTMDGKPITDNKLLSQLAAGDSALPDNPVKARYEAIRQSVLGNKNLDAMEINKQLAQIDQMENFDIIRMQVPNLKPEERVPELRKIVGMFPPEKLRELGFTAVEITQAMKPAALAQPKANAGFGGSATNSAAPANPTTNMLRDQVRGLTRPPQEPVDVRSLQPTPVPYGVRPF